MNNDVDITILYRIWPKVVENVKMRRRLTWSLILTSAQILTLDDEVITIGMLNSLAIDSFIRTGSDLILSDAFEEVVGIRRKIKITKYSFPDTNSIEQYENYPPEFYDNNSKSVNFVEDMNSDENIFSKKNNSSLDLNFKSVGLDQTLKGTMLAQPGEKSDLFSYASFVDSYEINAPFSLIDFETSGFHPNNGRILEVAVVKIDSKGQILDEFTTLVNPRDGKVGRTDIHQITLSMVKNAPLLSEILGDLIKILDSTIIVAHNARFEENFLGSAFREFGVKHPLMPTVDTLWLARQVIKLPDYKLGTIVDAFDCKFEDAHTALGDVRAIAKVLPKLINMSKKLKYPSNLVKSPFHSVTGSTLPRNLSV